MGYVRFDVEMGNSQAGSGNPTVSTFHLLKPVPVTDAQVAAQLIACLNYYGRPSGTSFLSITKRVDTAAGSTPVPWPTAPYSALRADNSNLAELGGYGATFGNDESAPVGTAWTESLYTAIPGRKTTGRLYVPWVNLPSIVNGFPLSAGIVAIVQAYRTYLLGEDEDNGGLPDVPPPDSLQPVVHSATAGDTLITTPVVSSSFSSLKSRRR